MACILYNLKDKRFDVSGVKTQNVEDFKKCCEKLNECINTFAKQQDNNISNEEQPQDTQSFGDVVSRGIDAIEKIRNKMCSTDFVELKRDFKIALIQKKYNIDYNKEMDSTFNKFFRKDEKWWKRIKIGGSHLFSKKATIKGQINRWFRQLVDYEGGNTDFDKIQYQLIEKNLNQLFQNLKQHKENKQKQREINNYNDKSIGLNTAFNNGHNNII